MIFFRFLLLVLITPSAFATINPNKQLRIQTYNVKGLPPLAAPGWGNERLQIIAQMLRQQIAQNTAPDVVLLQEVFTKEAIKMVTESGYPYFAQGPTRDGNDEEGPYQKIYSGGLYILSLHPILESGFINYGKTLCGTYDCHANKGLQYVKIHPEHLNTSITIFNTHMQSGKDFDEVRIQQANILTRYVLEQYQNEGLLVVGGDFNSSPERPSFNSIIGPLHNIKSAGQLCLENLSTCKVSNNTNLDELYAKSIDHLFIYSPKEMPKIIEAQRNFTELFNDKPLSDHLGHQALIEL